MILKKSIKILIGLVNILRTGKKMVIEKLPLKYMHHSDELLHKIIKYGCDKK